MIPPDGVSPLLGRPYTERERPSSARCSRSRCTAVAPARPTRPAARAPGDARGRRHARGHGLRATFDERPVGCVFPSPLGRPSSICRPITRKLRLMSPVHLDLDAGKRRPVSSLEMFERRLPRDRRRANENRVFQPVRATAATSPNSTMRRGSRPPSYMRGRRFWPSDTTAPSDAHGPGPRVRGWA